MNLGASLRANGRCGGKMQYRSRASLKTDTTGLGILVLTGQLTNKAVLPRKTDGRQERKTMYKSQGMLDVYSHLFK